MPSRQQSASAERRLVNKVAVITGASRGIGLAIADGLAAAGSSIVMTARNLPSLKKSAGQLRKRHEAEILAEACDVSNPEQVDELFGLVEQRFGRIDILVNNAGIAHPLTSIEKMSVEIWNAVVGTNLTGLFLCTRAALPMMPRGSSIVNNLSVSAKQVFKGFAAYDASKHGALGFTRSLREELRERGVRVVALLPGATDTEIWDQFWPDAPREKMVSPATIAAAVVHAVSLPPEAAVSELMIGPTAGAL